MIPGAGGAVSAGSDIGELARLHAEGGGADPLLRRGWAAFEAIAEPDGPVIAAVEGTCLGGGWNWRCAAT